MISRDIQFTGFVKPIALYNGMKNVILWPNFVVRKRASLKYKVTA